MLHKICGNKYKITLDRIKFLHSRCPFCFGTPKKTTESIKKEMAEKAPGFILMSEYKGTNENIKILHEKCQTTFERNFVNL